MIQTLPIDELAGMSDLIAIAKLKETKKASATPEGFQMLENTIIIEEVLKGSEKPGYEAVFSTIENMEDNPVIRTEGKFIIFLTKNASQTWNLTNMVQGYWPILDEGKFAGMGLRYDMPTLKKAIEGKK
ncbi:MAG: hypothetical protein HQM10_07415 [Candidatus Riflebacteria bacterium]|nr:hypothetical protein [Candidatus Riflebacteria bacterium]